MKRSVLSYIGVFALGYCTGKFVINVSLVKGKSMEPTLKENDVVISISRFMPISIKINDIVIAKSPLDPKKLICKRVLFMEDDIHPLGTVPKSHLWIEGDNKQKSYDSRSYGPVPLACVKSVVVGKVRSNVVNKLLNLFKRE